MSLSFRSDQFRELEGNSLRRFAAEVTRTLAPVIAERSAMAAAQVNEAFAFEQLQRAEARGLTRRNEMMAWVLCAMVIGSGFEHRLPQVALILADQHYDRSVLLTLLAMQSLESEGFAT